MSKTHSDYIPQNPAQFNSFMMNLLLCVKGMKEEWGHIPDEPLANLEVHFALFNDAFEAAIEQNAPAQTIARNETQDECTKVLREFVNQYLSFPPVTNVDRMEMGVPNHDTVRT